MKKRIKVEIGFFAHESVNLSEEGPVRSSMTKQVTPRTVLILGGKDVTSPSHPKHLRATTTLKKIEIET